MSADTQFSRRNLDLIFQDDGEERVLDAVELCCLPEGTLEEQSYADRGSGTGIHGTVKKIGGETVMEAVGYIVGERTPKDLRDMKASSVAWCLDRNNYVQM